MKDVHTSTGTGELHLGWIDPGKKVCLGVGPVVLRFTVEEVRELGDKLRELLGEDCSTCGPGKHSYTPCGCPTDRTSDTASLPQPVKFSWDDENWGHGSG